MSTTELLPEPPPMEVLIPSLPNDIALNILARVPRQYNAVLSAVSKSIRSAVSSPGFFAVRSLLNCTESISYLREGFYRQPRETHDNLFALYPNPNPNPVNNSNNLLCLAPVPKIPSKTQSFGCAYAAVGPKIYVIGGCKLASSYGPNPGLRGPQPELSSDVWVLDCRYHKWERGPSILTPRFNAQLAVVDGKIYVFGGVHKKLWVEVLDPAFGRWEAIPGPLDGTRKCDFDLELMNSKIRIRSAKNEFRLDPTKKTWEIAPNEEPFPTRRTVEKFEWFDERVGVCVRTGYVLLPSFLYNQLRITKQNIKA